MKLYLIARLLQAASPLPSPLSEPQVPPTTEQAIFSIIFKALSSIVEQQLTGVLVGIVFTLWFVYRYSDLLDKLEEMIKKIDKINTRQRIIIQAINSLSQEGKKGGIIIDSEEPTGEL